MKHYLLFPLVLVMFVFITRLSGQDCPNIQGQVSYLDNSSTPLYGVQVMLKTMDGQLLQTGTTDYLGRFSFCQTVPGDYQICASSTSPVGGINATDALLALRHYIGQLVFSGLKYKAGDVNSTAYINSTDAMLIIKRVVGQLQTFPAGDWLFEMATVAVQEGMKSNVQLTGLCYGDLDATYIVPPCSPMPSASNAGPDQNPGTTTTALAGNIPESGTGVWRIISGEGGMIDDTLSHNSNFTGLSGNSYILVWTITTICASSSDTVEITFTDEGMGGPCPGLPSFEYEGQVYNTVKIGTQCWMKENLNIGTMIPIASSQTDNGAIEKYCYNNEPGNCDVYGAFYQFDEMMQYNGTTGSQGICPAGWHIPTDQDWCIMVAFIDPIVDCEIINTIGTDAGGKMKEWGETYWLAPNTGATNESGFSARGAGYRFYYGSSVGFNTISYFWSSSFDISGNNPARWGIDNQSAGVAHTFTSKLFGYSVRCIKDN